MKNELFQRIQKYKDNTFITRSDDGIITIIQGESVVTIPYKDIKDIAGEE